MSKIQEALKTNLLESAQRQLFDAAKNIEAKLGAADVSGILQNPLFGDGSGPFTPDLFASLKEQVTDKANDIEDLLFLIDAAEKLTKRELPV